MSKTSSSKDTFPTIKYIAEAADVSTTTVSRVINNPEKVNAVTRKKVQAVIDRHNYRPNPAAQGVRLGRSGLIGMLLISHYGIGATVMTGIIDEAAQLGMSAVASTPYDSFETESAAVLNFLNKPIDGLIYTPAIIGQNIPQLEYFSNIPIIGLRKYISFPCTKIFIDNEKAGYLAASYLLKMNHKSIAILISTFASSRITSIDELEALASSELIGAYSNVAFYVGYKAALKEAVVSVNPDLVFFENFDTSGSSVNHMIIASNKKIDGVIAMAGNALHLLALCRKQGISVPEELSIVSIDRGDHYFTLTPQTPIAPPLTYIDRRGNVMGRMAVQAMVSLLNGKPVTDAAVEPTLIIGESTAKKI